MAEPLAGLEDVVIATSTICFIDGEKGILRYRGYDAPELAEKSTYEETAYLLLYGRLPTVDELTTFQKELRSHRASAAQNRIQTCLSPCAGPAARPPNR